MRWGRALYSKSKCNKLFSLYKNIEKMPMKKTTKSKKMRKYRRRAFQRTQRRYGRASNQKVHYFKRRVLYGQITLGSGSTSNYGGWSFKLDDISNVGELSALFDEYCISKIVVTLMPRSSLPSTGIQEGGEIVPLNTIQNPLLTVIDYNDSLPPADRAELLQYETCRFHPQNRIATRVFTPKVDLQGYVAGGTAYLPKHHQWISTSHTDVPHFGLKYAYIQDLNQPADSPTTLYDAYATYYIKLRNAK